MKLIVGLGNPGKKYAKTRHNLGFMVIDALARMENGEWKMDKKFNSQLSILNSQLILVKPQTMMNASGIAVAKISQYHNIASSNIWVIHDDVDLALGKLKIRIGGAAAGHHGVESVIKELGTDKFVRFRLGVGRPCLAGRQAGRGADGNVERYVLQEFTPGEGSSVKKMVKRTVKAIQVALENGLERAMNEYNA